MQKYIIAAHSNKINPFFAFFLKFFWNPKRGQKMQMCAPGKLGGELVYRITKTKNVQYAYVNIPAGVRGKGYEKCSVDKPVETVKKSLYSKENPHFHNLIHRRKNDRIFTKLFDERENETDYATAIIGNITKNGTKKEAGKFKKHGFNNFLRDYYGKNRYFAIL